MAKPCCPKCGNSSFEMREIRIEKANFPHSAIYCSHCGAVVAIHELMSVVYMLHKIAERLGVEFR